MRLPLARVNGPQPRERFARAPPGPPPRLALHSNVRIACALVKAARRHPEAAPRRRRGLGGIPKGRASASRRNAGAGRSLAVPPCPSTVPQQQQQESRRAGMGLPWWLTNTRVAAGVGGGGRGCLIRPAGCALRFEAARSGSELRAVWGQRLKPPRISLQTPKLSSPPEFRVRRSLGHWQMLRVRRRKGRVRACTTAILQTKVLKISLPSDRGKDTSPAILGFGQAPPTVRRSRGVSRPWRGTIRARRDISNGL